MNTTKMYTINTLSNMHVGSGEVNYSVIDNLIQRDPITFLPVINSSGLKGAMREYFKDQKELVLDIFGSEPKDESKLTKPGKARFFEANILSLPVRSNNVPYMMATSVEIIKELVEKIELFNCHGKEELRKKLQDFLELKDIKDLHDPELEIAVVFNKYLDGACVEDINIKATYMNLKIDAVLNLIFGERLVVLSHKIFKKLCDNIHLPVMARNNLNDGISANLWYEQVLPRYTRLYFMLMDGGINKEHKKNFENIIHNGIFQIGANASIGYGFCKFNELSELLKTEKNEN